MQRVLTALSSHASVLLGSVLLATVPTVGLAAEQRPTGRFDDRVLYREGGRIAVESRAPRTLDASDPLRAEWEAFLDRHGAWRVYIDERTAMPLLASGAGIEWFDEAAFPGAKIEELETLARGFLFEQRTLLGGSWTTVLELDAEASSRIREDHWQLVLRQVIDGVWVENARLDFHVKRGRLVMFGASHWGTPTTSGVPSLEAAEARKALETYLGTPLAGLDPVGEPELTLVALDANPSLGEAQPWTGPRGEGLIHALIWRLRFRVPGEAALWVGEVDAHDGRVRAFYDGAHYNSIRGGVFPISNDGDCPAGGCEVDGFPMPFADYSESGQPETITDEFGNLQCVDAESSVTTGLVGPYVRIEDACGTLAESGTCETGLELGLKNGENCDVEPGSSPGNTAAARSAFYHVNRIAEAARFYDPDNSWLQQQLTVKVNIGSSCNAFWNGDLNMYGEGNGCGNTGELHGLLVHEWGHGYDENDGGGFDVTSEAYADVVAIFAARDSCVGRGQYNDGRTCAGYGDTCLTCTGLRDMDWAARERNTPTTPENFLIECPSGPGGPCNKESHCESYPISEAIFDLATRDLPAAGLDTDTAWQLAERLWYESRPGSGGEIFNCFRWNLTHSCGAGHWLQTMRVADDDDGDLSNGTPHAAALFAAFDRHEIGCGNASDADNQSTTSCAALAAPTLSLVETPAGTELSWPAVAGADAYRVYRGDLGCGRQQIPLASLPATETGFLDSVADSELPRYYRVEAFGTNPVCHSPVSNCESTPLGARLQKQSHRLLESAPGGNGIPDPGETVRLPVTLFNSGLDSALTVNGRLRLADPAQGRILEPGATWADLAPSEALESDDPHFEMTVFEGVTCGETLELELDAEAANAAPSTRSFQIQLGDPSREFINEETVTIPPETTTPVTSTILIDQDHPISELDVSIDITHGIPTELIVELSSPGGTTVRLHDGSDPGGSGLRFRYDLERAPDGPGTLQDFVGESTLGTWTLSVEDVGSASSGDGYLRDWTLHLEVASGFDCEPVTCSEPTPTEAPQNLHVDKQANGQEIDLELSWSPVTAAGYHVLQSSAATFGTAVELAGRTAGATTLTMTDGANTTPALTFFQVRGTNSCSQEGP